jgi:plastocyanin
MHRRACYDRGVRRLIELVIASVIGALVVLFFSGLKSERMPATPVISEPTHRTSMGERWNETRSSASEPVLTRSAQHSTSRQLDTMPAREGTQPLKGGGARSSGNARGSESDGQQIDQRTKPPRKGETLADNAEAPAGEETWMVGRSGVYGLVRLAGEAPPPTVVDMTTDPVCGRGPRTLSRNIDAQAGLLAGVFVYVSAGLPKDGRFPPRADPVVLDQRSCMYEPRVLGVQVGQPLQIVNSDPTLHNIHAYARRGEFNQAMPKQNQTVTKAFKSEQVLVPIKCDVHKWMQAWIGVVAHPFFAITGRDGTFAIPDLPTGKYELALVHPTLGAQRIAFAVVDGAATRLDDVVFQASEAVVDAH